MKQYVVDAFTDKVFAGNPAAVCVMDKWLSDELMMKITVENNLSETAFCVKEGRNYHLRWFTPRRRDRPVRPRDARYGVCDPALCRAGADSSAL